MKKRVVRDYVHFGCGFPVVLKRVEMLTLGPDEIPWVNDNDLTKGVLSALVDKPTRLTGNEVRFIRLHYQMKLKEFGKQFDVTHPAVKKWEARKDEHAGMVWATEAMLRLFVLRRLNAGPRAFEKAFDALMVEPRPVGPCTLHLDLDASPAGILYDCAPLAEAS